MTKRNKNRSGYKETKAGWIPESWTPMRLGDCIKLSSGAPRPDVISEYLTFENPIPVYGGNGIMGFTNRATHKNDNIIIGRVGEKCGCVHLVVGGHYITDNALYTKEWLINGSIEFFAYYLDHFNLSRLRNKGGQPLVSQKPLSKLKIPLPPLPEQKKIAEILSAWDRAIEQTHNLINAKKRQKKGLMQQLLTGRMLFPEFGKPVVQKGDLPEGWMRIKLGKCFKERNESNPNLPLLSITSDRGVIPREEVERKDTSTADKTNYKRVVPGDIGYNTMRMWQGVSAVSNLEGIVSPAYTICIPNDYFSSQFFGYLFKYPPMINLFHRYSQGLVSDTLNLKFRNFAQILVNIPTYKEQRLIAMVLNECDNEINRLNQKVMALKKQKKGLMQKLLTGEVRVKT